MYVCLSAIILILAEAVRMRFSEKYLLHSGEAFSAFTDSKNEVLGSNCKNVCMYEGFLCYSSCEVMPFSDASNSILKNIHIKYIILNI